MFLIYMDESGNSGNNLGDPQQPVFCLCAMIVPESSWQAIERELKAVLDEKFPTWQTIKNFEVHGNNLRNGTGNFVGMPVADRISLRDAWLTVGEKNGVKLITRSIHKKRYGEWMVTKFGPGVVVNPHVVAFALISRCVDDYLMSLPGSPLGIFISDENKDVVSHIEKSIHSLRQFDGSVRLSQIIEKGFFIDSCKSLLLQLCDLFTLSARKMGERSWDLPAKSIDDSGIAISQRIAITNSGRQQEHDVVAWLTAKHSAKKERPGV